jgi:hypothetical protein
MEHPLDVAKDEGNCKNLTITESDPNLSEFCLLCVLYRFALIFNIYTFCTLCTDSRSSFSGMLTGR